MSLGCLMIDISGPSLSEEDRDRLLHPLVGGVVLFTRHFQSVEQLQVLCEEIHALRHPKLLIGVDHEGGRVQRFREGFSALPPMRPLGELYDSDPTAAKELAEKVGWLMATELLAVGVDFSFAPVLDLDYGDSCVIGDRSFHSRPQIVSDLAFHLVVGMRHAGMAAVAKHFPGHGYIQADTHLEVAVDDRSFQEISQKDLQPFLKLIENNIEAIMPAHVRYPQIDHDPAGFSHIWLQDILRNKCYFQGAIISDDMSMHAATEFGDAPTRVEAALKAGCDLVLLCNDLNSVDEVLTKLKWPEDVVSHARLIRMHGKPTISLAHLHSNPLWQGRAAAVSHFVNEVNQRLL